MARSDNLQPDCMPLRVLLIGNYALDRQHSMQRYFFELAEGLKSLGADVQCVRPGVALGKLAAGKPALEKWLGHFDKYVLFRLRMLFLAKRYDVVHIIDHSNAIYVGWAKARATIITCHDLIAVRGALGAFEGARTRLSGQMLQRAILNGLRRCPMILCVSEATRQDVIELVAPLRVAVIPNALRDSLFPMSERQASPLLAASGPIRPYFLHVGGNTFYKNRVGVVRVFDELASRPTFREYHLVLAGKRPDDALREAISAAKHSDRIVVIEDPNDTTLQALYSTAEALLFLSLVEGFGWPILEAQACDCVVVTTDRPPMRDVGGTGAILVDPEDIVGAADRIEQAMPDAAAYRANGRRNAEHYRPERIYAQYLDVYRSEVARAGG